METNEVWFRFYEELNDFLAPAKRGISFSYQINGNPSVKDAIEALGVPHVEVDMIIVNGEPVDFSYKVKNEDRISVYPVFESFDISATSPLRTKPLRETRFVLDVHLGRLTKYLRLCGFDAFSDQTLTDNEIINLSLTGHRIILTRDKGLLKNKRVTHGYWIRSTKPEKQLNEVLGRFDLRNNMHPFSRCLECNEILDNVPKEEILNYLLPQTIRLFTEFRKCKSCGRIYWEGSHYEKMKEFIKKLFP